MGVPMKILERMDSRSLQAAAHELATRLCGAPAKCQAGEETACCDGCMDIYALLCGAWNEGAATALSASPLTCRRCGSTPGVDGRCDTVHRSGGVEWRCDGLGRHPDNAEVSK